MQGTLAGLIQRGCLAVAGVRDRLGEIPQLLLGEGTQRGRRRTCQLLPEGSNRGVLAHPGNRVTVAARVSWPR